MSRLRRSGRRLIATVAFLSVFAGSVTLGSYLGIRNVVDSDTSFAQAGGIDQGALTVALTPPMGWNGYNRFGRAVTASMVEAEARALVRSGMKAAGYTYINLDGGWALPWRDSNGALIPNPFKFPDGIKAVADYVHNLGFKFGIYTSAGMKNCYGSMSGSYGHYRQDVATFASWGVDYVKFDRCFIPYGDFPHLSDGQIAQVLTRQMGAAIAAVGRPMVYDLNFADVQSWAWPVPMAAMWRTTRDIKGTYRSLLSNFRANVTCYARARPGRWNDPDMLEIGNRGLTVTEQQAQFSLWAEMAAPLIAGNDLTTMTPAARAILTNLAVIAVDQDPLGRQGYAVASSSGHWVLTKLLANGDRAVVLFNATDKSALITTTVARIGLTGSTAYSVLNLWTGMTSKSRGQILARVAPHGVVMFVVTPMA